jgi:hypothetical protein
MEANRIRVPPPVIGTIQVLLTGDSDASGGWVNGLHGLFALVVLLLAVALAQEGKRSLFGVTRKRASDLARLRAGQVRLIVLPGGEPRGAGKGRPAAGGVDSNFFLRSA